jgi:hypothetical protein
MQELENRAFGARHSSTVFVVWGLYLYAEYIFYFYPIPINPDHYAPQS